MGKQFNLPLYYLIISTFVLKIFYSKVIAKTPILEIKYVYSTWIITLNYGLRAVPCSHIINQELNFTWIRSNTGLTNEPTIPKLETEELFYNSNQVNSRPFITTLTFNYENEILIDNIYFKELEVNEVGAEIGLSFLFEDKNYSITHQLYNQSIISQLSYSITCKGRVEKGALLTFGGISLEISSQSYSTTCKVNNTYIGWNCNLSYVLFTNNTITDKKYYKNKAIAYFNAKASDIIAPLSFMNYLNNTIFKEQIEKKNCEYMLLHRLSFHCNTSILELLPKEISFVFESNRIVFNMSLLFDKGIELSYLTIYGDANNDDHWVFGKHLYESFSLLFNYETEDITFYSDNEQSFQYIDVDSIENNLILSLRMKVFICFLLFFTVIALYLFIRKKVVKKKELNRIIKFTEVKNEQN